MQAAEDKFIIIIDKYISETLEVDLVEKSSHTASFFQLSLSCRQVKLPMAVKFTA